MRLLTLFLPVFMLPACQLESTRYYADKDLVPILRDLHYARAATYNMPSPAGDSLYQDLKAQVCLLHGVSQESLDHDLKLLLAEPEDLEQLYELVIDSLESTPAQQPAAY